MNIKIMISALHSAYYKSKFYLCVLCLCIVACITASEDDKIVNIIRTDGNKNETVIAQLTTSKKVLDNFQFFRDLLEDCGKSSAQLQVPVDEYNPSIAIAPLIKTLFTLAEDSSCKTCADSGQNTILIELAEKLKASETLCRTISQISFADHVYENLYGTALSEAAYKNSTILESATAQKWFIACISKASDLQKTEIRKKLYPLQYQSVEFVALEKKVVHLLKAVESDTPEFHTLEEFKNWQNSFLHQAYCAARPSNAISCAKFHTIWEQCRLEKYNNMSSKCYCIKCNSIINDPSWVSSNYEWNALVTFGCNTCIKKELNNKVVDLSDCYSLGREMLQEILTFYKVLVPINHLRHLPQIHIPLLVLLFNYKKICFYDIIDFGKDIIELDSVDIKALAMFKPKSPNYSINYLICNVRINSKNTIKNLKKELTHFRKGGNFYIKFIAPDADQIDTYKSVNWHNWKDDFSSIWVNNWLLRGVIVAAGLYCIAKCVHYGVQKEQIAYEAQLGAYNSRINQERSIIPERIQSITGYLAETKDPIPLNLPSELQLPSFKQDPSTITLPDIKAAQKLASTLNAIARPEGAGRFWFYFPVITVILSCVGTIIKDFFSLDYPLITACRIAVVKP